MLWIICGGGRLSGLVECSSYDGMKLDLRRSNKCLVLLVTFKYFSGTFSVICIALLKNSNANLASVGLFGVLLTRTDAQEQNGDLILMPDQIP